MEDYYLELLLDKRGQYVDKVERLDESREKGFISELSYRELMKDYEVTINTLDWCIALYRNEQEKKNKI